MIISKQDLKIYCYDNDVIETATIQLLEDNNECTLLFSLQSNQDSHFKNYDFFACLIDLRVYLANNNCFPLCNGARRDVCCGGMLREATKGCWGYVITDGEIAKDEDEVYIFDYADPSLIGSVDEQKRFCQ